jgi:hypothetical protein
MRAIAFAVMVAAACGGKREAPRPPAECARVLQHVLDLELGKLTQMPSAMQASLKDAVPAYRTALIQSCANDHWPDAAISCLAAAKSADEAQACSTTFTPDQLAHVGDAYAKLEQPAKQAAARWMKDVDAIVKRACACADVACRTAAQSDYDRATAEVRASPMAEMKSLIVAIDRKEAACQGSAAGSAGSAAP